MENYSGSLRVGDVVVLKAQAKINLFLLMTGRNEAGYHLIDSFFCFTEDLYDEITLSPSSESTHSVEFLNSSNPIDADNTVTKALRLVEGYIDGFFEVTVTKNLPVAAGIGGGSADGAALLRYFGELHKIPKEVLIEMALSIGCDTVPCLYGQPCHVTGLGEKILEVPRRNITKSILLVFPNIPVAAAAVYEHFRESKANFSPGSGFAESHLTFEEMIALPNDLADSAISIEPCIQEVLESIKGCRGNKISNLCGSGSTCIGIFDNDQNLKAAYSELKGRKKWWVRIAQISL